MAISFAQLRFAEPSPEARRLLWHVLSIGPVSRDEPERHEGLDKAGLFLFQVAAGTGHLEMRGNRHRLARGQNCWLVDLRQPRIYRPAGGKTLRTEGVRFSGPGVEAWLELLGRQFWYGFRQFWNGRFSGRSVSVGHAHTTGPGTRWAHRSGPDGHRAHRTAAGTWLPPGGVEPHSREGGSLGRQGGAVE